MGGKGRLIETPPDGQTKQHKPCRRRWPEPDLKENKRWSKCTKHEPKKRKGVKHRDNYTGERCQHQAFSEGVTVIKRSLTGIS